MLTWRVVVLLFREVEVKTHRRVTICMDNIGIVSDEVAQVHTRFTGALVLVDLSVLSACDFFWRSSDGNPCRSSTVSTGS